MVVGENEAFGLIPPVLGPRGYSSIPSRRGSEEKELVWVEERRGD